MSCRPKVDWAPRLWTRWNYARVVLYFLPNFQIRFLELLVCIESKVRYRNSGIFCLLCARTWRLLLTLKTRLAARKLFSSAIWRFSYNIYSAHTVLACCDWWRIDRSFITRFLLTDAVGHITAPPLYSCFLLLSGHWLTQRLNKGTPGPWRRRTSFYSPSGWRESSLRADCSPSVYSLTRDHLAAQTDTCVSAELELAGYCRCFCLIGTERSWSRPVHCSLPALLANENAAYT